MGLVEDEYIKYIEPPPTMSRLCGLVCIAERRIILSLLCTDRVHMHIHLLLFVIFIWLKYINISYMMCRIGTQSDKYFWTGTLIGAYRSIYRTTLAPPTSSCKKGIRAGDAPIRKRLPHQKSADAAAAPTTFDA